MYGFRNDDENMGFWVKILLLAMLLGTGSAAIDPVHFAQPEQGCIEVKAREPNRSG